MLCYQTLTRRPGWAVVVAGLLSGNEMSGVFSKISVGFGPGCRCEWCRGVPVMPECHSGTQICGT